jgi:purine-binding chemotaxis protein CheW
MNAAVQKEHTPAAAAAGERQQYLTFMLGKETFAVSILRIKEIIEYGQLTTVPMMPVFIRGVINLRGAVVPVMDLMARFGQDSSALSKRTCVVILEIELEGETQDVGILVDAVNEVLEIAGSEVEPAPRFGTSIRADFISGMGKVNGKFVIILDLNRIVSSGELQQLAEAAVAEEVRAAA